MTEYELKPVMNSINYHDFDQLFKFLQETRTNSVLANISPEDKSFFVEQGWMVAGIVSNHFELGRHALKIQKILSHPGDGVLDYKRASNTHESLQATERAAGPETV